MLDFQLHVFVARKYFPVKFWYLCITQLLSIVFRSTCLLKMISYKHEHTLSACIPPVGRTLSDGQNFPILLAAPASYWRLACLYSATSSRIQHDSMLKLVFSSIPAESFVAIQHCENKFQKWHIFDEK